MDLCDGGDLGLGDGRDLDSARARVQRGDMRDLDGARARGDLCDGRDLDGARARGNLCDGRDLDGARARGDLGDCRDLDSARACGDLGNGRDTVDRVRSSLQHNWNNTDRGDHRQPSLANRDKTTRHDLQALLGNFVEGLVNGLHTFQHKKCHQPSGGFSLEGTNCLLYGKLHKFVSVRHNLKIGAEEDKDRVRENDKYKEISTRKAKHEAEGLDEPLQLTEAFGASYGVARLLSSDRSDTRMKEGSFWLHFVVYENSECYFVGCMKCCPGLVVDNSFGWMFFCCDLGCS
ncbi:hypothetical protein ZWY2020_052681 [Hordeum vulgare]|nr:hypothetical protein ZWY2020_052681 [Hordeum vulgare]